MTAQVDIDAGALETDSLFLITSEVQADPSLRAAVATELKHIAGLAAYGDWSAGLEQRAPFDPGPGLQGGALARVGLLRDNRLRVRLNLVEGQALVTDGVWVDPRVRVFPFADESTAIHRHCQTSGLLEDVDAVIDLATGSGNNLAHFAPDMPGIGFDINPRALAYFHMNQCLTQRSACMAALNDIRRGFHDLHPFGAARHSLVVGNMPFGLAPTRKMLALTSDGGETGMALQRAAFEAVARFRRTDAGRRARVSLLGYSVGNAAEVRWEMVDLALSILGPKGLSWTILADEGLVRIDGKRILANPSPLAEALHAAGGCALYHRDPMEIRQIYAELADRLIRQGMPDLSYLVVDLRPDA
jgi:hypothetical protein